MKLKNVTIDILLDNLGKQGFILIFLQQFSNASTLSHNAIILINY